MTMIRTHRNAIEAIDDDGDREIATFHPDEECMRAYDRSEADRLAAYRTNWPRRFLVAFGWLALVVYFICMWTEGRP